MDISILGCGWLGLPLAEHLRDHGFNVKGSTTSPEKLELLSGKEITPFLISLKPDLKCNDCDEFWNSDVLVLNIPPGRSRDDVEDYYPKQIETVIKQLQNSKVKFVIFVSSTSVYPTKAGIVSEEDARQGKAARTSGNALLQAENLLLKQSNFKTTVVRFGGLYGQNRHPAKYLAGKKDLENGNAPVNLIHREDCIGIIHKIMKEEVTGSIFNGVSDGHPPKKMYYPAAAEALELELPTFIEDHSKEYKVVSNRKIKQLLNYDFKYPNPMDFNG